MSAQITWTVAAVIALVAACAQAQPANPLAQPSNPLAQPSNPLALPSNPLAQPSPAQPPARPACPTGWAAFRNPLVGIEAYVPPDYWVRLRGGLMLTIEKQQSPQTVLFIMPMRPKRGISSSQVAESFVRFISQSEPRFRAERVGQATPERANMRFVSVLSDKPVEGRFCAIVTAGGSMAFVIGVAAPQGQLAGELPTLQSIAQSIAFVPPQGRWMMYRSPAGGFSMALPQGWSVQSGDGTSGKDNIDWVAFDPQRPLSRAFQWCPRFCSPQLLQDPLHAMRGYQPGAFQNHEQVVVASLSQIAQNVQLKKLSVNAPLTTLFRAMQQQMAQFMAAMQIAQMDIVVYDCLAEADIEGRHVVVAFVTGIQTMAINGGFAGSLMDFSVTQRGWCAAPEQFIQDSPVLERICASMELSAAFLNRITEGNEKAAGVIRDTYARMNEMDNQIRDSHWNTMDAIAEMNYDNLRDYGGYVNERTGRIEQIDPNKIVKNSSGEMVSREEVESGVPADQATVLRGAYSNDYMKGTYGRIEFPG